ncbi:MAG: DUF2721 domain-containing protein [Candidatus Aminicenantes bacterium]|nr:DUF2721 domain-containing protein [Candidatus Aminicenantes bacterium]
MKTSIIQIIQTMLVPGVMVSACALLLLGMNNKYSSIVNRIRLLKDEERRIDCRMLADPKGERKENIDAQLPLLMARLRLVRNTVTAYSTGILLFILSSFFIGLQFVTKSAVVEGGVIVSFLAGMVCVLAGVIHNAVEARKGFEVIRIEATSDPFEAES